MSEPLSYQVELGKPAGIDTTVAGLANVAAKTSVADAKIKELQGHLNSLKAPGEIKRLEHEIANFGKPVAETFKGIGHAVETARGQVSHFMDFLGAGLAVEGITKVVEGVMELGHHMISAAAGAERLDLSFKLTVGAEGAEEILGWIDKIASKTEFTDGALKGWALQLLNAGVAANDLDEFMSAALDVAGKRGPQAMEMALDALSRANLSGSIEGRTLRGLGIPVAQLAELDKFKGLNTKQINKKLETTSITKDELLGLIAGPDKLLGDIGIQAGDTMTAKIKNLTSMPEQLFEKFANSPSFDVIKSRLDDLFTALDPNGPTGAAIFQSLDSVLGAVVEQVKTIDFKAVAATIVDDVVPAIKDFASIIGPIVEVVAQVVRGFRAMGPAIKVVGDAVEIGGFITRPDKLVDKGLAMVAQKFTTPASPAILTKNGFGGAGSDAAKAMAAAANHGAPLVAASGANLGQAMIDGLDEKIERHSPPKVFLRVGADIPRAVALGIEGEQGTVTDAIGGMMPPEGGVMPFSSPSIAGAGGAGGFGGGIEINVTVQMGAGGDAKTGEEVGKAAAEIVEERLVALLERLGLGMGAEAAA